MTTGLCDAFVSAEALKCTLQYLTFDYGSEGNLRNFMFSWNYLQLEANTPSNPVNILLRRCSKMLRYPYKVPNRPELIALFENTKRIKAKQLGKTYDRQLDDSSLFLARLLIEKNYKVVDEWLSGAEIPAIDPAWRVVEHVSAVRVKLARQQSAIIDVVSFEFAAKAALASLPVAIQNYVHHNAAFGKSPDLPHIPPIIAEHCCSKAEDIFQECLQIPMSQTFWPTGKLLVSTSQDKTTIKLLAPLVERYMELWHSYRKYANTLIPMVNNARQTAKVINLTNFSGCVVKRKQLQAVYSTEIQTTLIGLGVDAEMNPAELPRFHISSQAV